MKKMKNILFTGATGFSGWHVLRLMTHKYPNYNFVNIDLFTYCLPLYNQNKRITNNSFHLVELENINQK